MSDRKQRANNGRTKKRGRPRKPGRSRRYTIRLREGEHDAILERIDCLPAGQRSAYIRRVLAGAPVDLLDGALVESDALAADLDAMWDDWEDE